MGLLFGPPVYFDSLFISVFNLLIHPLTVTLKHTYRMTQLEFCVAKQEPQVRLLHAVIQYFYYNTVSYVLVSCNLYTYHLAVVCHFFHFHCIFISLCVRLVL